MNIPDLLRRAESTIAWYQDKQRVIAHDEFREKLRAAAAEMEQSEPVYQVRFVTNITDSGWKDVGRGEYEHLQKEYGDRFKGRTLYPAPVAPAVPEGWKLVPVEPTQEIISGMACSVATDSEGEYPPLMDIINYSGENKTRTVLKAAYKAMLSASPEPEEHNADGGEMRLTVSYLSSFLNEINKSECGDRDELLEYHLEKALQWLDAAMKKQHPTARR